MKKTAMKAKKIAVKAVAPKKVTKKASSKIKPARILFVLDRSGSMGSIVKDTIGGYNTFLNQQKQLKAKTSWTLAQFDNVYELVYDDVDINEVPELNDKTYMPRGSTALRDAVGRMITTHRSSSKDELTILAILTDGEENASREFSHEQVADLIKEAQDELGWEVLFLGANFDAFTVGASYGVAAASTVTYDANAKGLQDIYATASIASSVIRGYTGVSGFSGFSGLSEQKMKNVMKSVKVDSKGKVNLQALYNSVKETTEEDSQA